MHSSVRVCVRMAFGVPSGRCSWVVGQIAPTAVGFSLCLLPLLPTKQSLLINCAVALAKSYLQLSAMDVSVRSTMKGAAKCDKHCELQNSVNRQGLERILCFWDIPESMPASVSMLCYSSSFAIVPAALSARASGCACPLLGYGALEAFD